MPRDRGRPAATSVEAIHAAASALFREIGFDATTMPMIAERLGIGRSTLFRYFPSKRAILWHQFAELLGDFRARLAAQPEDRELADGAFEAYREIWAARPHMTVIGREIIRTLETSPSEATGKWQGYEAFAAEVHAYALRRTGLPPSDTGVRAAAMSIWAAIWAGATGFGLTDGSSIDEHLRAARAAIDVRELAARSPRASAPAQAPSATYGSAMPRTPSPSTR